MLNNNFKIAVNNSMFSGKGTFSHIGLKLLYGDIDSNRDSDSNTFSGVFNTAEVSNSDMSYEDQYTNGGLFLALCSDDSLSYNTFESLDVIKGIVCNDIKIVKNNAIGATVIATLTNNNNEDIIVKSVYLAYRLKTRVVPRDYYVCFYDAIFGKALLENPIVMKPGEQRTFEYQIKF